MQITTKSSEVCKFFDITAQTLSNWKEQGCPQVKYGTWDLKAVFDWWWENIASDKAAREGGDESMNEAKRIYWWEKAKGEQYKNEQLAESLIAKDKIAKEWAARVAEVASGLSAMTDRLPPLLEGKTQADMRQIISDETWRMRDHYARKGKFCPAPTSKKGKE